MPASEEQVGGDHYLGLAIQPAQFAHANRLAYLEGVAVGYICRHGRKGGREQGRQDIAKAIHALRLLSELEYGDGPASSESLARDQRQAAALAEVARERRRQDERWGQQQHRFERWLCILAEEVGELSELRGGIQHPAFDHLDMAGADARAWLEDDLAAEGAYTLTRAQRAELVQIAAVCVAWLEAATPTTDLEGAL